MDITERYIVKFPEGVSRRSLNAHNMTPVVSLKPPFVLMLPDNNAVFIVFKTEGGLLDWRGVVFGPKHPMHKQQIPLSELYSEPAAAADELELCAMIGDAAVRIPFTRVNPYVLGTPCNIFGCKRECRFQNGDAKDILKTIIPFYDAPTVLETGPPPPLSWDTPKTLKDFELLADVRRKSAEKSAAAESNWKALPKPAKLPKLDQYAVLMDANEAKKALATKKSLKALLDPQKSISTRNMRMLIDAISLALYFGNPGQLWLPKFREIHSIEQSRVGPCYCCSVKDHRNKISKVWIAAGCIFGITKMIQKLYGKDGVKLRDLALPYETTFTKHAAVPDPI